MVVERPHAGGDQLRRPDGRGDGGLPPLLRPPRVQDLAAHSTAAFGLVTARSRRRGHFNCCLRLAPRAPRKKACCGGRATTDGTIATRIPRRTFTRPA